MNNVVEVSEDEMKKEKQGSFIKMIRDSIGNYSWDSSASSVNGGIGVNEWSQADIEKVLNDEYLNKRTGENKCYKGSGNVVKACPDWENIGIKDKARNMIANIKWHTGTLADAYDSNTLITKSLYVAEQSENTGKICQKDTKYCSDTVTRTTTWIGKIGLMNLSEVGYAVGSDVRTTCLEKTMYDYDLYNCMENDWLYDKSNHQWTIVPLPSVSSATDLYIIDLKGDVYSHGAAAENAVRPTLYLKSDVKIVERDYEDYGSIDHPFELSYE